MAKREKSLTLLHTSLWIVQLILALSFGWASFMKLFQPITELSAMWPWTGQIPTIWVKCTGIIDLIAAIGLLLPSLLRIKPVLTPVAAVGVIILMVCALVFHMVRGEASVIGANVVFAALAAFVAWGRSVKAPIYPNQNNAVNPFIDL